MVTFMRRFPTFFFAVAVLTPILGMPEARASRATTSVLGTGDGGVGLITAGNGSLFYDDPYNVFYNPSYLANYRGWATVERSNSTGVGAQGGLIYSLSKVTFGAYVNRADAIKDLTLSSGSVGASSVYLAGSQPSRPIELMVAGDLGIKLGAALAVANTLNPSYANSFYALSLGAQVSIVEPFVQVGMGHDTSASSGMNHLFIQGGSRVRVGEYTPFVLVRVGSNSAAAGGEHTEFAVGGGAGRSSKLAEAIRLNWASGFWFVTATNRVGTALAMRRFVLPLEVSAEADVTVWLTLRAGLTYAILNRFSVSPAGGPDGTLVTATDNTSGRLGASFHVSRLDFDWAIGSTAGAENLGGQTFDLANGFFTQASLSFRL